MEGKNEKFSDFGFFIIMDSALKWLSNDLNVEGGSKKESWLF